MCIQKIIITSFLHEHEISDKIYYEIFVSSIKLLEHIPCYSIIHVTNVILLFNPFAVFHAQS